MNTTRLTTVSLILFGALSTLANAEEIHGASEHQHSLSVFLGNTHENVDDEFTIGVGYERRLNEDWGMGGLIEYAGGKFDSTILGIPVFFYPDRHWRFWLAPGVEIHSGDSEFLVRAGVGYEIELNE